MRFLLDENVPNSYKNQMKKLGYENIKRINDFGKGMKDKEVFELSVKEHRTIISIDTDFFEWKKEPHFGIVSLSGKLKNPIETMNQVFNQIKKDERFKISDNLDNLFIRITNMDFTVGRKIKSRYKEVKCKYKKKD